MNVDTLKSNPEQFPTSKEAIQWTEKSPNSKLFEIKNKLDANKSNENVQKLQELIKGQEYRKFQKEIWIKPNDWKLWKLTLETLIAYIEKESKIWAKIGREELNTLEKAIKWKWLEQETKPKQKEISDNKLHSYTRIQRWIETIDGKDVKYERKTWVEFNTNEIHLLNRNNVFYDSNAYYRNVNEKINNISIRFIWDNISINDKYVIHPSWTMCEYKNKKYLDTWTRNQHNKYQNQLTQHLYNFLKKNRDRFEVKKDTKNETTEEIIDINRKNVSLFEKDIAMLNEDFIIDMGFNSPNASVISDLNITKIGKKWKKIYINDKICLEPRKGEDWKTYIFYSQKIWWQYFKAFEAYFMQNWKKREGIYRKLDKYFS